MKESTSLLDLKAIRMLLLFLHFKSKHRQNMFSRETRSLYRDEKFVTSLMHHFHSVDSNRNKVGTVSTMLS